MTLPPMARLAEHGLQPSETPTSQKAQFALARTALKVMATAVEFDPEHATRCC